MARRAELAGIIRPEVDDRALDQEAKQMESRLNKAAKLTPDIDSRKIKRELERAIPGGGLIGTAADALRGGGSGGGSGATGGDAVPSGGTTVQTAQLEKLEDIHDELEQIGQSGGVGSGGADGGPIAGAKSVLSKTVFAGGVGAAAISGSTGAALSPGVFGKGSKFKPEQQKTGPVFGTLTGTSGQTKSEAATSIRKDLLGSEKPPLKELQRQSKQSSTTTIKSNIQKPPWLSDLRIEEPAWVSNIGSGLSEPDWVSTLESGNILSKPDWVSELDKTISVETPDWIDSLSNVGLNLNVDIPSPKLQLSNGQLQRQLEQEFNKFRDNIVDEAVSEIEKEISFGGGN
jgi:hypothetical protein